MAEIFVAAQSDMQDGDRLIVRTETGAELGVFFSKGEYFSYSYYCVHSGGPACAGHMITRVLDMLDSYHHHYVHDISNDVMHFVTPRHAHTYTLRSVHTVCYR